MKKGKFDVRGKLDAETKIWKLKIAMPKFEWLYLYTRITPGIPNISRFMCSIRVLCNCKSSSTL
jgi:hypothetical protein